MCLLFTGEIGTEIVTADAHEADLKHQIGKGEGRVQGVVIGSLNLQRESAVAVGKETQNETVAEIGIETEIEKGDL